MGKKRERHDSGDSLRWYEIITCCCKWRKECKSCMTTTFLYFVPIIFLICLFAACLTVATIWRNCCPYKEELHYWVYVSSHTPFWLLFFIKAVKEKYNGCTFWRLLSLVIYLCFAAWMIIGSIWIYDTWNNATSDNCNKYLKTFAFILTFVHWFFLALATIPNAYILAKLCCCYSENVINPLKSGNDLDAYQI